MSLLTLLLVAFSSRCHSPDFLQMADDKVRLGMFFSTLYSYMNFDICPGLPFSDFEKHIPDLKRDNKVKLKLTCKDGLEWMVI